MKKKKERLGLRDRLEMSLNRNKIIRPKVQQKLTELIEKHGDPKKYTQSKKLQTIILNFSELSNKLRTKKTGPTEVKDIIQSLVSKPKVVSISKTKEANVWNSYEIELVSILRNKRLTSAEKKARLIELISKIDKLQKTNRIEEMLFSLEKEKNKTSSILENIENEIKSFAKRNSLYPKENQKTVEFLESWKRTNRYLTALLREYDSKLNDITVLRARINHIINRTK